MEKRIQRQIKKLKNGKDVVFVEMTNTIYVMVKVCSQELGWKTRTDEKKKDFTLFWIDPSPTYIRISKLLPYQKINHFPGTNTICKKHQLVFSINDMQRKYPKEDFTSIVPKSWVLPLDTTGCLKNANPSKWYIIKPYNEAQGRGIVITKISSLDECEYVGSLNNHIVSEYVNNPVLFDGYKFDLRIYVMIKSLVPQLRLFYYNEGLVRLCSEKYVKVDEDNRKNRFMHLSNYSINKKNANSKITIKKTFKTLNERLGKEYGEDVVKKIWLDIEIVILKTILCAHEELKSNFRKVSSGQNYRCFEILGFDIILVKEGKRIVPRLLEVNVTPSFHGEDSKLDYDVKHGVLKETMQLLGIDPKRRTEYLLREQENRLMRFQKGRVPSAVPKKVDSEDSLEAEEIRQDNVEEEFLENFVRIFPTERNSKYGEFLKNE